MPVSVRTDEWWLAASADLQAITESIEQNRGIETRQTD
jgi:hypothetical protein